MSGVLVVAEHRRGVVADVTFELIRAGLRLRDEGAGDVTVAIVGGGAAELGPSCAVAGVREVMAVQSSTAEFEPHVTQRALEEMMESIDPAVVLCGHTVDAFGFAPALAAHARLGFASNVMSASWSGGELRARRGLYGDRLVGELAFDRATTLLMVRPGAYPPTTRPEACAAGAEAAPVRVTRSDAPALVNHIRFLEPESNGIDITSSEFLLSIGRGIGEQENVERFSGLADMLSATLSASRPLVDAGWVPSARQVGQSGRTVKPKVYLALGISGAAQHLAGIRDAETVIAVNTDPEAPIFNAARYGAVVDIFDLADELESRIER